MTRNEGVPIRLITTDYHHSYLEIPGEAFDWKTRLDWIRALITHGDIIYRRPFEHIDLTPSLYRPRDPLTPESPIPTTPPNP